MDIEQIREFVKLVERYGLAELSLEEGDISVTIKGYGSAVAPVQFVNTPTEASPKPRQAEAEHTPVADEEIAAGLEEEELAAVVAPLVGVFYRTSAPDAPPLIEVGDLVEAGQEIGLIEAMKVFSPIPSDVAGTVVAIPAQSGKLVQQGDVLVLVRPIKE